jgi:UDPglucose--hexose-1-phosphate uridylyltransferase
VLPARLKKEMKLVGEELAKGTEDIAGIEEIRSHAEWYKKLRSKYPSVKAEETEKILQREIGKVFEKVLTHAGVYKRTEEGMAAFDRFVESV